MSMMYSPTSNSKAIMKFTLFFVALVLAVLALSVEGMRFGMSSGNGEQGVSFGGVSEKDNSEGKAENNTFSMSWGDNEESTTITAEAEGSTPGE